MLMLIQLGILHITNLPLVSVFSKVIILSLEKVRNNQLLLILLLRPSIMLWHTPLWRQFGFFSVVSPLQLLCTVTIKVLSKLLTIQYLFHERIKHIKIDCNFIHQHLQWTLLLCRLYLLCYNLHIFSPSLTLQLVFYSYFTNFRYSSRSNHKFEKKGGGAESVYKFL